MLCPPVRRKSLAWLPHHRASFLCFFCFFFSTSDPRLMQSNSFFMTKYSRFSTNVNTLTLPCFSSKLRFNSYQVNLGHKHADVSEDSVRFGHSWTGFAWCFAWLSLPAGLGSVCCVVFGPNSAEMEHSAKSGCMYGILRMKCVGWAERWPRLGKETAGQPPFFHCQMAAG